MKQVFLYQIVNTLPFDLPFSLLIYPAHLQAIFCKPILHGEGEKGRSERIVDLLNNEESVELAQLNWYNGLF
ncbi:MAG TPA: hypothetical protein DHW64_12720 [Chitinophagaceae bacterium]|nr:hypothetical protein [Chitinophagaceae bacterium]